MEIKEYLQSIHGFRLMKMIIYLSIIPTVIIFGYLLKIDYDNNKNSLKKKTQKEIHRNFDCCGSYIFFS